MNLNDIPMVALVYRTNGGPASQTGPQHDSPADNHPYTPVHPPATNPVIPVIPVTETEDLEQEYEDNMLLFNNDLFGDED